jgi:hypothetical protein
VTDGARARGRLKVAARTRVEWPAGGLEEGRREKLVAGWIQGVWG